MRLISGISAAMFMAAGAAALSAPAWADAPGDDGPPIVTGPPEVITCIVNEGCFTHGPGGPWTPVGHEPPPVHTPPPIEPPPVHTPPPIEPPPVQLPPPTEPPVDVTPFANLTTDLDNLMDANSFSAEVTDVETLVHDLDSDIVVWLSEEFGGAAP